MAVQPEHLHAPECGGGWNARRVDQRPVQSGTHDCRLRSLVHASIRSLGFAGWRWTDIRRQSANLVQMKRIDGAHTQHAPAHGPAAGFFFFKLYACFAGSENTQGRRAVFP